MRTFGMTLAAVLAVGAATADGLTFSGYVPGSQKPWTGSEAIVSYLNGGTNCTVTASNVVVGADNYVNVTVETPTPVAEGAAVTWNFGGNTVRQTVRRTPYVLVADAADKIAPLDTPFVAKGRLGVAEADVTNRLRVVTGWIAPQTQVTLGAAGDDRMKAGDFTVSGADVALSLTGNVGRVHLLGTGTVSRISIAGGRLCEAQTNVTAATDGFLEIKLNGVVEYSKDAAYGERPDRDAFCRICTMVAMDLQDAQGANQLDEVFGPFRRTTGGKSLVYRPWIVPSSRLSGTDGKMTSRLMLTLRAGDRFTLCLAYAEYFPDGDRLRPDGGGRFATMRNPLWIGDGCHAEAEFTFHAFGGEK